jgi:hypothetical protein
MAAAHKRCALLLHVVAVHAGRVHDTTEGTRHKMLRLCLRHVLYMGEACRSVLHQHTAHFDVAITSCQVQRSVESCVACLPTRGKTHHMRASVTIGSNA